MFCSSWWRQKVHRVIWPRVKKAWTISKCIISPDEELDMQIEVVGSVDVDDELSFMYKKFICNSSLHSFMEGDWKLYQMNMELSESEKMWPFSKYLGLHLPAKVKVEFKGLFFNGKWIEI